MNGDLLDPDVLDGPVPLPDPRPLHPVERVVPADHLAEHRVAPVEVRARPVRHEELRAVGVGLARVGHRDDAARVVPERRQGDLEAELPVGALGEDGPPALPRARGVAALDHEALDVPVEGGPVVGPAGGEGQEVLAGEGRRVAAELELEVAQGGVEGHGL